MNEEELRAFLESATVGDDEEQTEEAEEIEAAAAEPTAASPSAPAGGAPDEPRALSFDELIGRGMERARGGEEVPLVLPGPPTGGPSRPVTPPASSPPASPEPPASRPAAAAEKPRSPARPAPSAAAPTTPMPVAADRSGDAAPADVPQPVSAVRSPRTGPLLVPVAPSGDALPPTQEIPAVLLDDDYERVAVTGGESEHRRFIPWLIVAAGVVIALLGAFFVVNALTAGDDSGGGQQTTSPESGGQSTAPTSPSTSPSTPTTSQRPTTPGDEVPDVEVGPTMNLQVTQWGIQVDMSQKLGLTARYEIPDGVNLQLSSSLIDSYAAVCPGGQWGMTRIADDEFEVLKPSERCAAAPELYDELWGLMDAMVQTARPL